MSRKRKLKIGVVFFFCLVGLINTSYVRSGQSTVVQPVPSLSIWGLGFMSVLLAFVARRRRDVHKSKQ